eukprot:55400-Chlamydomonas_euryale.AAC.2
MLCLHEGPGVDRAACPPLWRVRARRPPWALHAQAPWRRPCPPWALLGGLPRWRRSAACGGGSGGGDTWRRAGHDTCRRRCAPPPLRHLHLPTPPPS